YVSPRLKGRVESAIKALRYQPNHLARGLATQQSRTLGMIVPDIANPFFPEVVRGAEDAAYAAGYTLLIASSDNDPVKEELYLRLFLPKRVDGVILTKAPGRLSLDLQRAFVAAIVPIVLLARTTPGLPADVVEMDDKGAAFEGVMHLHRLGYRRIAFIGGGAPARPPPPPPPRPPPPPPPGRRPRPPRAVPPPRVPGRAALRAAKRRFDPALVTDGDFRVESGYRAGLELLKRRPDAVFIANYLMTVGFMEALRQYRMRCPDDVAVVTCDDHPWLDAFSP